MPQVSEVFIRKGHLSLFKVAWFYDTVALLLTWISKHVFPAVLREFDLCSTWTLTTLSSRSDAWARPLSRRESSWATEPRSVSPQLFKDWSISTSASPWLQLYNAYVLQKMLMRQFLLMKLQHQVPAHLCADVMKRWLLRGRSFLEEWVYCDSLGEDLKRWQHVTKSFWPWKV